MKYLIVLALAAVAYAADVPQDTPEVAAAKAAFAVQYNAAAAAAAAAPDYPYYPYSGYPYGYPYNVYPYSAYPYAAYPRYNGPLAVPVVLPSGYLADTPEVAAARAAHAAEVAKASA